MAYIGEINTLKVLRRADHGLYLEGEGGNDILLPNKYVPEGTKITDEIDVFVYRDSEDRIIATNLTPKAMVGDFAVLEVVATTKFGAFLDWGLEKDLFVPFKEQKIKMVEGRYYVVAVYLDESTDRVVASAKIGKFLSDELPEFSTNEEVSVLVYASNEIGFNCIINNSFIGIIYKDQVFDKPLKPGQRLTAYATNVREDGKTDLSLLRPGYEKVDNISKKILEEIIDCGGYIAISDKSPADMIYSRFGISKKNFKKAIGSLYKQKLIDIEKIGIRVRE